MAIEAVMMERARVKIPMAIMFPGDLRRTDSQQAMAKYVTKKMT